MASVEVLIRLYHRNQRADGVVLLHCPRHISRALIQDRPRETHVRYLVDLYAKEDVAETRQEIGSGYTCVPVLLHDRQVVASAFRD